MFFLLWRGFETMRFRQRWEWRFRGLGVWLKYRLFAADALPGMAEEEVLELLRAYSRRIEEQSHALLVAILARNSAKTN